MLGNSFEHCFKLIPLIILINFPTVEVEVCDSTLAGDILQGAHKLCSPRRSRFERSDVLISPREIKLQQTMTNLNICRVSVSVRADIPVKRIFREIIQEIPAGARG